MGTPTNCDDDETTTRPCDDGNACTVNDMETILNSDGTICEPCAGIPLDCASGPSSVVSCDDGDPNTINDVQTILDCDGRICVPCQGVCAPITFRLNISSPHAGGGVSCLGASDAAVSVTDISSTAEPLFLEWSNGSFSQEISSLSPGWYTLTVTDGNGCTGVDSILVREPAEMVIALQANDSKCFGENNGSILFDEITGGTPPYRYSIDGNTFVPQPLFNQLSPGRYVIAAVDANGCMIQQNVGIAEPDETFVSLGLDTIVRLGDSILVDPTSNVIVVDSFIWLGVECVNCPDAVVMPFTERAVSLTITNLNGCEADDGIRIGVDTRPNVYVPSAFSPNNDGVNDVIYPFAGRAVESIINFQIFDRWGEKVFETNNFAANAIESGWDGRLNGKLMNPQVLIYSVEILLINGDRQVLKGDFVLMR
jgi:gliding motility-associated-like protein